MKNKNKALVANATEQAADTVTSNSKERPVENDSHTSNEQASNESYSTEQLAATFTIEDWENLYAFVEEIDSCSNTDGSYDAAWTAWANTRDNQTPEQWRQYFEKVVRPQWMEDSVSKRQEIKERVEKRLQEETFSPARSQNWNQTQDSAVTATHTVQGAPVPSDLRLASESTAQPQTPSYIRDGYESALKRIRGGVDDGPNPNEALRPTKMRRGNDPLLSEMELEEQTNAVGTQEQLLEVLPAAGIQHGSPRQRQPDILQQHYSQEQVAEALETEEDADSVESEYNNERLDPLPRPTDVIEDNDDLESIAEATDLAHIAPLPRPLKFSEEDEQEDEEEDDLPSNSPTPRAYKYTAFDTQAILSPSQASANFHRLPRSPLDSSPPQHASSDISTTQSLQEFSSYLRDNEHEHEHDRPASPTPSTESTASESADPDPPLSASEMDAFFLTQQARGFSTAFITAALKRTRCRPGLAGAVLDAWGEGAALPVARGISTLR